MSDIISRQMAIDALSNGALINYQAAGHNNGLVKAIDVIKGLPSAQSEIIRCKDCKWWRSDHTCHEHSLVSPMLANEFCSRAERRTNG